MNRSPNWLLSHQKNVHSQTGEDGVVEKILDLMPARDGWCVEFGAWDGLYYTNTRHLIESKGYSAVLIEASPRRFRELKRNYAAHQNVYPMCQFVGFRTDDNLDTILRRTPANKKTGTLCPVRRWVSTITCLTGWPVSCAPTQ